MSLNCTRMLAYFTFIAYLAVSSVAFRFLMPTNTDLVISTEYLNAFTASKIVQPTIEVSAPEMHFADIVFPTERKIVAKKPSYVKIAVVVQKKREEILPAELAENELPFADPIKLSPVVINNELPVNLVSLYKDFSFEEKTLVASNEVIDEVTTSSAKDSQINAEGESFDYTSSEGRTKAITETPKSVASAADIEKSIIESEKKIVQNDAIVPVEEVAVNDLVNAGPAAPASIVPREVDSDIVAFDYSAPPQATTTPTANFATAMSNVTGFDYSSPAPLPSTPSTPKLAAANLTTQQTATVPTQIDPGPQQGLGFMDGKESEEVKAPRTASFSSELTIQVTGTNFKKSSNIMNFEVRFQDDLSEIKEDFGSGQVQLKEELAAGKMTRSVTVLKRGYAPTNTDLIMEEGASSVSVPSIEEDTFNNMMNPFMSRGPIGAVLVELDDETEEATLDAPFSKLLHLDGDLKITKGEDYRYQLFIGVKAGNSLLSYKVSRGETISKIIHIHENELTFDANYFENVANEKIKLFEEDLLAKDKTPLIIASEQVLQFGVNKSSKKINDHTYQMDFNRTPLAGRKYLELNHQGEPVFLGFRENQNLVVPSESFMRLVLSRFEGAKLGNRCLIQVNLSKKAEKMDVSSESVAESIMTLTQALDNDGKFYDSLGDNTQKIIVVGEGQGATDVSQDAKINIKVQYQDGTTQFLSSYCSPNTYLVEQL